MMAYMKKILLIVFFFQWFFGVSQDEVQLKWWNPTQDDFPVVEGQITQGDFEEPFDRLPFDMEDQVREDVWNLSKHSAGLMIRFRSSAEEIVVRYGVPANINEKEPQDFGMNHMPATGVSGVDLYTISSDGQELWCASRRQFSDTIIYRYSGLRPNDGYHKMGREYRLYLPLYNQVTWMEIGVGTTDYFKPLPVRPEKPIVVYGTSIAQGACASRPGMAWTNMVSRKLDRPLINLGFSGNGRLEQPLIDMIGKINAKIVVLDCLPNLTSKERNDDELKQLILDAVHRLRSLKPTVPVLLADHAGYTDALTNSLRKENYERVNRIQQKAFYELRKEGVDQLYYLSKNDIGLSIDDMVDGTHPSDLGMNRYAAAYEEKLRKILQEPIGQCSTTIPCTQYREPDNYDWEERHRAILEANKTDPPKTVILANSIVHFWGGLPLSKIAREEDTWEKWLTPLGVRNYAYGWDRIENVLWRIHHGELDGFQADRVLIMIGTNNLHLNTDEEILQGLDLLVQAIKVRQPSAEIVMMGILPRKDQEQRVANLNTQIVKLSSELGVDFADLGTVLLKNNQTIDETLFSDGLHPNTEGYLALRNGLIRLLNF